MHLVHINGRLQPDDVVGTVKDLDNGTVEVLLDKEWATKLQLNLLSHNINTVDVIDLDKKVRHSYRNSFHDEKGEIKFDVDSTDNTTLVTIVCVE